jgi:hypothetical protein
MQPRPGAGSATADEARLAVVPTTRVLTVVVPIDMHLAYYPHCALVTVADNPHNT